MLFLAIGFSFRIHTKSTNQKNFLLLLLGGFNNWWFGCDAMFVYSRCIYAITKLYHLVFHPLKKRENDLFFLIVSNKIISNTDHVLIPNDALYFTRIFIYKQHSIEFLLIKGLQPNLASMKI